MAPTLLFVLKVTAAAHTIGRLAVIENHLVLGAHGANDAPTRPAVMLSDKEGKGDQADLALLHDAVGHPVCGEWEVGDQHLIRRFHVIGVGGVARRRVLRVEECLPELLRGVRDVAAGVVEEVEHLAHRDVVQKRGVARGGRGTHADAPKPLLLLLRMSPCKQHYVVSLAARQIRGDPVERVVLQEVASLLRLHAAQSKAEIGVERVERLGERNGAQLLQNGAFAGLDEGLRMVASLSVGQDEDVLRCRERDDAIPHIQHVLLGSVVVGNRLPLGRPGLQRAGHVRVQDDDAHVLLHRSVEEGEHRPPQKTLADAETPTPDSRVRSRRGNHEHQRLHDQTAFRAKHTAPSTAPAVHTQRNADFLKAVVCHHLHLHILGDRGDSEKWISC